MKITARIQEILMLLLESLVLFGLIQSGELSPTVAFALLGLRWVVSLFGIRFLGPRQLLVMGLMGMATSAYFVFEVRIHPLIIGAWAPFWLLILLAVVRGEARLNLLRLGVAFLGLVLLCSLTPDFFVAMMMLAFMSGACLILLIPYLPQSPLERGYYSRLFRHFLLLSVLVLVFGLLIYPFLPRPERGWSQGFGQGSASVVGYSDEMRLGFVRRSIRESQRITALRIFPKSNEQERLILKMGLLRSRVLSEFDGQIWKPNDEWPQTGGEEGAGDRIELQETPLLREALRSSAIPHLGQVLSVSSNQYTRAGLQGEWHAPGSDYRRLAYTLRWTTTPHRDPPQPAHRFVPESWKGWWASGRRRIFGSSGSENPEFYFERIRAFFLQGFVATDPFSQGSSPESAAEFQQVLQKFLEEDRRGHCQFFAFAGAALLRLEGIPARLVSGFRLSRPAFAGVLSVKEADSHVWVEAWDGEKWRVLDFTPALQRPIAWLESFEEIRDWAEGRWGEWVAANLEGGDLRSTIQTWAVRQRETLPREVPWASVALIVGAVLLTGLVVLRSRSEPNRYSKIPFWLRRIRRLIDQSPSDFLKSLSAAQYERLRWDPELQQDPLLWRRLGREVEAQLRRASPKSGNQIQ
jgi:hypothetical protein